MNTSNTLQLHTYLPTHRIIPTVSISVVPVVLYLSAQCKKVGSGGEEEVAHKASLSAPSQTSQSFLAHHQCEDENQEHKANSSSSTSS